MHAQHRISTMTLVVMSDFDGTIVEIDTCVYILNRFAETDWKALDERFERSEITLEECLQSQFSTIKASKAQILHEIEKVTRTRNNFASLIEYCRSKQFQLVLVSAGLDFIINHFLASNGWKHLMIVHAPKAEFSANGIRFTFPRLIDETSANFKEDVVKSYSRKHVNVAYIGDGVSDYPAARRANIPFAIRNSKLAEVLNRNRISHHEIEDFREVIDCIERVL